MKISEYLFLYLIVSVVSGVVLYFLPEKCAYAVVAVGVVLQSVYAYELEARKNNLTIVFVTLFLTMGSVVLVVASNVYVKFVLCRLICYTLAFSSVTAFASSLLSKAFASGADGDISVDKNELTALKAENENLNRMYVEKKEALASARDKILSLQREQHSFRQSINDANEKERENLKNEKREAWKVASKLKLQLTAAQNLNAELRAQAMQNEQTGHQNDAAIKSLQAKKSVAESKIEELKDDKKMLEAQIKHLKQQNAKEIQTLQTKLLEANEGKAKAEQEVKQKLEEKDKIIASDKKKLEEEKQKYDELKQSFDLMQNMYQEVVNQNIK